MDAWKEFFFKAMSGPRSYAGGGKAALVDQMPGVKRFFVMERHFRLIDQYSSADQNGFSTGNTFVWEDSELVLSMSYAGKYEEDTTEFLRDVLRTTYLRKEMHGFRGRPEVKNDTFTYCNDPETGRGHGSGLEMITRNDSGNIAGWHRYTYYLPREMVI